MLYWHSTVLSRDMWPCSWSPRWLQTVPVYPGAPGHWMGKQESQANPASLPTSMLDLESPITGSSKVRTSSRLEPA